MWRPSSKWRTMTVTLWERREVAGSIQKYCCFLRKRSSRMTNSKEVGGKKKDWYMCMIAVSTYNASLRNHNFMAPSHPQMSDENHDDEKPTFFSSCILDMRIWSSPCAAQFPVEHSSGQWTVQRKPQCKESEQKQEFHLLASKANACSAPAHCLPPEVSCCRSCYSSCDGLYPKYHYYSARHKLIKISH